MRDLPPPEPEEPEDRPGEGHLEPIGPGPLVVAGMLGMVLGWIWHPLAEWILGSAPLVGWLQAAVLFFVAAFLGALAWATHRTVQVRRERLAAQQALNRLVLARACALVGALVAGVYVGYAVSWLGSPAELAGQRIWRSLLAAAGGVVTVVSGKLLERACRVPKTDPHP